ncbi:hypothetical protein HUO13_01875 [Saccharopolyspora erythraea]|uniref:hypothetical protein n=1 Tax=Saccharopolyspora erythraea TaxID=1836 RepID=UPI001BABD02C|nr:hypothetical protein [Saccharopolyspora erythraea]QUG99712.1 hypothetical protein HUO13_01875 [Saccharopolyspora erythraea]
MTPEPLPPTSFCAAGHASPSLLEHERTLVALHESGALRLIDGGREGSGRRWRMSWGHGSSAVRAMLGVRESATDDGEVTFWVHAEARRPWSIRDQRNPVERMGLLDHGLKDPSSAYSLTEQNPLFGLREVGFLEHTFSRDMRDSPVLVYHGEPGTRPSQEMRRFRNATKGMCGLLPVDDAVRERVNDLLPADRRIPHRAVRLYVPPWWVGHEEDITVEVSRLDRPGAWRRIADTVIRVSSWRGGGKIRATAREWSALLDDPMNDVRIVPATRGGSVRWLPAPDDSGKRVLRRRLDAVTEEARAARDEADSAAESVAHRRGTLDALTAQAALARRSRRRLAELALRLRQERDSAEAALRAGSVAAGWREAREAELEAELYAEELDRVDDEVVAQRSRARPAAGGGAARGAEPAEPAGGGGAQAARSAPSFTGFGELLAAAERELAGLRFGPQTAVAVELDGHLRSALWRRRTWDVLELLSAYALRRRAGDGGEAWLRGFSYYVREFGGSRGISPSLVASGESEMVANTPRFRNARTFAVPPEVHRSGWEFFGAHVKIDRGGGVAPRLHYFDDTRGPTGDIHIGYLGPHLPSPESN